MAANGKVLVTGATGFVGSVLTRQLVADGADVRVFRREDSSLDLLGEAADEVERAVGDLTYARSLYEALEGVERVYHVAGKVSFARRDREALRRVNVDGTANVVNAALEAGVERVVHTSSIAALGRPVSADTVIDETTEWRDAGHRSAYARSKRQAELEVHRGIAEGLDAVLVNPSLVFGVGGPNTNTRRIVNALRHERLPAVPPGGTNVVDVQDVAAGHRRAMSRGETGRRYVLGGENLSWRSIAETLAEAFGVDPPSYTAPSFLLKAGAVVAEVVSAVTRTRPVLTRDTARTAARTHRYDNTRARAELDCSFRPFADTARRIAEALAREDRRSGGRSDEHSLE
jgi:dihydroflavonol-4-reductase